jgi:hypothetical protein
MAGNALNGLVYAAVIIAVVGNVDCRPKELDGGGNDAEEEQCAEVMVGGAEEDGEEELEVEEPDVEDSVSELSSGED